MAPLSLFQLVVADDSWRGEELETRGACEPECLSVRGPFCPLGRRREPRGHRPRHLTREPHFHPPCCPFASLGRVSRIRIARKSDRELVLAVDDRDDERNMSFYTHLSSYFKTSAVMSAVAHSRSMALIKFACRSKPRPTSSTFDRAQSIGPQLPKT